MRRHVHLDTTTIYIKVARPTDPLSVQSPIDRHTSSKGNCRNPPNREKQVFPEPAHGTRPSVGHFSFDFKSGSPDERGCTQTLVTLALRLSRVANAKPVYFTGIVATEFRQGWYNLKIPALETWQESLSKLSPSEKERLESPEFFRFLQAEISNRLTVP